MAPAGATRRPGPGRRTALAWSAILAVVALGLLAGSGALGPARGAPPSLYQRTLQVAGQYRCPVCQGESAAASEAPQAVEIRGLVQGWLEEGRTPSQIRSYLVADYGTSILERPPASGLSALVWALPVLAVVLGVAGLGAAFRRWRRAAAALELGGGAPGLAAQAAGTVPSSAPPRAPVEGAPASRRRYQRATVVAGVALMAAAAGLWSVDRALGPRQAGGPATGAAAGLAGQLQQASVLASSDPAAALAVYDEVLAEDTTQPVALTGEGWIYAQAGFVAKGTGLLQRAERADPGYAMAHFYLGLVLLDYAHRPQAAEAELQWYLAHSPAPALATLAREALSKARAPGR